MSEAGFTVKRSATDSAPEPAPAVAAPVDPVPERRKPKYPWISGWCSSSKKPHECGDGQTFTKTGEPIYRCQGSCENGEKVIPRVVYCACPCHRDPAKAGLAVPLDD